jgi:hypothetical protein
VTALALLAAGYLTAVTVLCPILRPARHRRRPYRPTAFTLPVPTTGRRRYTLAA